MPNLVEGEIGRGKASELPESSKNQSGNEDEPQKSLENLSKKFLREEDKVDLSLLENNVLEVLREAEASPRLNVFEFPAILIMASWNVLEIKSLGKAGVRYIEDLEEIGEKIPTVADVEENIKPYPEQIAELEKLYEEFVAHEKDMAPGFLDLVQESINIMNALWDEWNESLVENG